MRITKEEYAHACGLVQSAGRSHHPSGPEANADAIRKARRRAVFEALCAFLEDCDIEGGQFFDSEKFARDIGGEGLT